MQPFGPRHGDLVSLREDSRARFAGRPLFGTRRHGGWQWMAATTGRGYFATGVSAHSAPRRSPTW